MGFSQGPGAESAQQALGRCVSASSGSFAAALPPPPPRAKVYSWAERFLGTYINQNKRLPNTPQPPNIPPNKKTQIFPVSYHGGMDEQGAFCLMVQAEALQSSERLTFENKNCTWM